MSDDTSTGNPTADAMIRMGRGHGKATAPTADDLAARLPSEEQRRRDREAADTDPTARLSAGYADLDDATARWVLEQERKGQAPSPNEVSKARRAISRGEL